MNNSQQRILVRLGSMSFLLLTAYILIILYIRSTVSQKVFGEILLITTVVYIGLLLVLWYREKNLYVDYIMQNRINSGHAQYLLCPSCKVIQRKGVQKCSTCEDEWIVCQICEVPFEKGSKVLISPCCGQGFHYDHFEAALRELSRCPHCNSTLAVETANW